MQAKEHKDNGNKCFLANDFLGAVAHFTKAIELEPSEALYGNRCAAYTQLAAKDSVYSELALEDGRKCVEINPAWGKGYLRLGNALLAHQDFEEAVKIFGTGLAKEPTNKAMMDGLVNAQKLMQLQAEEQERKDDHVIGIDLGTTYSCVGVWLDNKVVMIPNDRGTITTPSYVSWSETGKQLVGHAAKNQSAQNPTNTVFDIKRIIGQRFSDPGVSTDVDRVPYAVIRGEDDKPVVEVSLGMHGKRQFAPEEISAMVLSYLKKCAEGYLKTTVRKAVITVPAYFNDAQRAATKAAGKIAGLDVLRIINEPTAAALAYGLDAKATKKAVNVLIFDLGGGTFDVSLLTIENGVFQVKATAGDTRLGGEDFDHAALKFVLAEATANGLPDVSKDPRALKRISIAIEQAKRELSDAMSTDIFLESITSIRDETTGKKKSFDFKCTLERSRFEKLNDSFFLRCLETCQRVLKDAKMKPEEVNDIVLVGGSTRIPKIQAMLSEMFGGRELCRSVNPDEAVAFGAAVQGAILNGKRNRATEKLLLLDVTPLSLGIETEGRVMSVIIPRNTPIPGVKTQTYTTTENYQTEVNISVYEGERTKTDDNHLLGEFTITGIERAKRGEAQIDVTFSIDSDGMLNVEAKDRKTGAKASIAITNAGRSSDKDIERMIKDAEKFRKADEEMVKRTEAVNDLEALIDSIAELTTEEPELNTEVLNRALEETQGWLEENRESARAADILVKKRALNTTLLKLQRQQAQRAR